MQRPENINNLYPSLRLDQSKRANTHRDWSHLALSFRLARFQSPTLQAIAVAQQQSSTTSEPIHYEVHIHNARGEHIKTTIDGEVVEEPDM